MQIPKDAATQGGCFTFSQAKAAGWTYTRLDSAVRRGVLHRVRRGVWVERAIWDALDARGQHVVSVRAQLLVLPSGWFAARRSAAVATQLPLIGKLPSEPQLIADKRGHAPDRHRKVALLPKGHTATRDGIPLTVLARTAVDLARDESFLSGVVVADAVLGIGVSKERLLEVLAELPRSRGQDAAREVIDFADGLSESALESLSRVRCREHRLPPPELQVEIWRGRKMLGRADKLWRDQLVVGEDDGMGKLGDTEDERGDPLRRMYTRGFDIDSTGLVVARWDWNAAWQKGGAVMAERIQEGFARGRTRTLDPDIRFVPTTVADRLERRSRRAG